MNTKLYLLGVGALFLLMFPEPAEACGGFFCSQVPVLQTAERVVFEMEGDDVTAYIQLQYQGTDPNFAWVIPVPEVPQVEVGVGTGMFDALEDQTRPIFLGQPAPAAVVSDSSAGCGTGSGGEPRLLTRSVPVPQVDVFKEASVGPFDYVVISAERAEELNSWLLINGYRVAAGSDAVVQAYLDEDMKLLALKLSPDAMSTQVEPIKLTYKDTRGCASIPIRLTAIASVPGLEIVTWVFGSARAAPVNYGSVEVDSSGLLQPSDYGRAVAMVVDAEADGQGFVTEYAQPSFRLSDQRNITLQNLLAKHGYVTRLRTFIDPDEMTVDPMFAVDATLGPVSNEILLGGNIDVRSSSIFVLLGVGMLWNRRRRR